MRARLLSRAKEQGMDDASLRSWLGAPMPVEQALLFALQIARGMKLMGARSVHDLNRDNLRWR